MFGLNQECITQMLLQANKEIFISKDQYLYVVTCSNSDLKKNKLSEHILRICDKLGEWQTSFGKKCTNLSLQFGFLISIVMKLNSKFLVCLAKKVW